MEQLPAEVLLYMARRSVRIYIALLAVPSFARFTLRNQEYIRSIFITKCRKRMLVPCYECISGMHYIVNHKKIMAPCTVTKLGNRIHSFNDKPSIEWDNGITMWHKYGRLSREGNLPTIVSPMGNIYIVAGKLHREDGPAIEHSNGTVIWYQDDKRHRDGDLPAFIDTVNNTQRWYQNGVKHRDNGPSVITPRMSEWYRWGVKHRDDGPAVECANGIKYWYIEGKKNYISGISKSMQGGYYINGERTLGRIGKSLLTMRKYIYTKNRDTKVTLPSLLTICHKCCIDNDLFAGLRIPMSVW